MEEKPSPKAQKEKKKPGGSGFVFYAVFVFGALAAGLVIILMRSNS
jgi:hypothetical protein